MPGFADICSMRILLLAATRAELAPLLHWLKENEYQAGGHVIITGFTGIGSLMSGWWMGRHFSEIRPQLVIQAGVAGYFGQDWTPGQLMAVKKDCLADLGVWENDQFRSIFDLKLQNEDQPPFNQGWLRNPHERLLEQSGLPLADAVTVNEISTSPRNIVHLQDMGARLESMEGAALHFACLQAGLPFLQIRSVSNRVGVRDKSQWQLGPAIQSLNHYLQHWLPLIKSEWL